MALVDSLAVKYMKRNQKQCISFCYLLLIHVQQGAETKSLGTVAYHRPTTPSPGGVVTIMTACLQEGTVSAITLKK